MFMFPSFETVSNYFKISDSADFHTLIACEPLPDSPESIDDGNDSLEEPIDFDNGNDLIENDIHDQDDKICVDNPVIIPFLVNTDEKIHDFFREWKKSLQFSPFNFESESHPIHNIQYIYYPYYVYSIEVESSIQFSRDSYPSTENKSYHVILPGISDDIDDIQNIKVLLSNFGFYTKNTTLRKIFNKDDVEKLNVDYPLGVRDDDRFIKRYPQNDYKKTWKIYESWFNDSHKSYYNQEFKKKKQDVLKFSHYVLGGREITLYMLPVIKFNYTYNQNDYKVYMSGFNGVSTGERPYGFGFIKNSFSWLGI